MKPSAPHQLIGHRHYKCSSFVTSNRPWLFIRMIPWLNPGVKVPIFLSVPLLVANSDSLLEMLYQDPKSLDTRWVIFMSHISNISLPAALFGCALVISGCEINIESPIPPSGTIVITTSEVFRQTAMKLKSECSRIGGCTCILDGIQTRCPVVFACLDFGFCEKLESGVWINTSLPERQPHYFHQHCFGCACAPPSECDSIQSLLGYPDPCLCQPLVVKDIGYQKRLLCVEISPLCALFCELSFDCISKLIAWRFHHFIRIE